MQIIQSAEVFSFSMDAVLLSHFCSVPTKGNIIDLCTGNGVIPLLLTARTKGNITGVEIQERLADMAHRSVELNQLQHQIRIDQGDIRHYHETCGYGQFDLVTVNPPYMRDSTGRQNINEYVAIARHEIRCTLEDVIAASSKCVKSGGKVAMVHRPSRIAEILMIMQQYRLAPKRIRFVHPHVHKEANMVLVEAISDGKPDVRLLPPLIVYEADHQYSEEIKRIYNENNMKVESCNEHEQQ
nr:tRNA1(Val) (adenine(37)-N6)-methyltransferase [Longirhabdus pacifica]